MLPDPPNPNEIEQALERVVNGRAFRASRNLTAFLRFIVRETLAGQGERLKEYTIGVEVFGRGTDFDPKADGVVRVHAGLLRKKLAAHYADEGRDEPVVIEVPKGGYVPAFRRAAPVAAPVAAAPPPARRRRWPWVVASLVVVASVSLFALRRTPPPPGHLWTGIMSSGAPTVLAVGVPQFFGAGGVYLRDILVNTPEGASSPHGALAPLQQALGKPLVPAEIYTGIGEAHGAVAIATMFARAGRELRVARSRHVRWNDIKDANAIFLASTRFRTLAQHLDRPADFVFADGPEYGPVINRKPRAGEPSVYESERGTDHAIVTLWPGTTPGRHVLLLSGRTTWGTQAAAEYVTRPEYLAELDRHLEACRRASGAAVHPGSFQVLLRVQIRDDQPLGVAYVTHHDLSE